MRRSEMQRVVLDLPQARPRELSTAWPFLYSVVQGEGMVVNLEPERRVPAPAAAEPAPAPGYTVTVVKAAKKPKAPGAKKAAAKRVGKAAKNAAQRVSALSLPDVWKRPAD